MKVDNSLSDIVRSVEGVKNVERNFVWTHANDKVHANIAVTVTNEADGQIVTDKVIN